MEEEELEAMEREQIEVVFVLDTVKLECVVEREVWPLVRQELESIYWFYLKTVYVWRM